LVLPHNIINRFHRIKIILLTSEYKRSFSWAQGIQTETGDSVLSGLRAIIYPHVDFFLPVFYG